MSNEILAMDHGNYVTDCWLSYRGESLKGVTVGYYRQLKRPRTVKAYMLNNLLAFDIQLNCLLGGRMRTLSERIGDIKAQGKLDHFPLERWVDKWILEKLDPGHSVDAYQSNKD